MVFLHSVLASRFAFSRMVLKPRDATLDLSLQCWTYQFGAGLSAQLHSTRVEPRAIRWCPDRLLWLGATGRQPRPRTVCGYLHPIRWFGTLYDPRAQKRIEPEPRVVVPRPQGNPHSSLGPLGWRCLQVIALDSILGQIWALPGLGGR